MKLTFLDLSPDERRLYFDAAAGRRDVSPVMLEKDFWVCWLLGVLFGTPFGEHVVFKGGTSLSKVFGVIDRFSEDIDLSVSPAWLGLPDGNAATRNQANRWMSGAEAACTTAVRDQVLPELESAVMALLGRAARPWFDFRSDAHTNSPILLFRYPSSQPAGFAYLPRTVKMEFGALTDQQPLGRHAVRPWVADALPEAFGDWRCDVTALELGRTFWEKATILHAEFHRPPGRPAPDRFSRHYADVAALWRHRVARAAVDDLALCERVARWKGKFFGSAWSRYDDARPGTFRLVPPPSRVADLRRDYRAMRDMYLAEPPPFESVVATLADLEAHINGAPTV